MQKYVESIFICGQSNTICWLGFMCMPPLYLMLAWQSELTSDNIDVMATISNSDVYEENLDYLGKF